MRSRKETMIKICCIQSVAEAVMAIRHGASAIGLISEMPSGPGVISEDRIAEIAGAIPQGTESFLLTSKRIAAEIVEQLDRCGTTAVQICDRLDTGSHQDIRKAMPGVSVFQVIHVAGRESIEEAVRVSPHVDGLLLDTGRFTSGSRQLGGTGRTHDWNISREIRASVSVPVFLAGGLKKDNVGDAVNVVRPHGVDVCSGVRSGGRLDETRLREFMQAVRSAQ